MIWSTHSDGYHDYVNRRWYDYTGVPEGSTDGEAWAGLFHPDDQERIRSTWRHCLATGEPYHIEYRLRHRSGQYRWVLGRAQPVRNAAGRITRWYGTCTDVHDLKQAEDALRDLNADLEQRVEEGTAKLVQLRKMESLGQLTGGIAHDFNNLLMAVLGSLELLRKRLPADDARAARLFDNAMQGAQRGVGLTRRLLAFARRQDLEPEPVNMPDLVMGMTDLLKRSIGSQVRIETHFELDVPRGMVDANQLEMAVLNLAVNARDAMPAGGTLTIAIGEAAVDGAGPLVPGRYVRLAVSDTGTGMDEATLRRATEPFFTTKGVGKGTGLGLSMVHGLAEQSGGRFVLHSQPGQGSTAEILLPGAAAGAQAPDGADTLAGSVQEASGHGALRVLVVDDDPLVLTGAGGLLEDLGHATIEASSGEDALEIIRRDRSIELVITDQIMPGMTGSQLIDAIRRERPDLPVILATGYAELPGISGLGVQKLNKPFQQRNLIQAVANALSTQANAKVHYFKPRNA
jgi:PAS domain S-box-containing protein